MRIPFTEYLHDEWEEGLPDELVDKLNEHRATTGLAPLTHDEMYALSDTAGRPFYEISIPCEYDTETGQVIILAAGVK